MWSLYQALGILSGSHALWRPSALAAAVTSASEIGATSDVHTIECYGHRSWSNHVSSAAVVVGGCCKVLIQSAASVLAAPHGSRGSTHEHSIAGEVLLVRILPRSD